jgi:hypothetical protein
MTIARKMKPGRNDLCPCGSGRKIKKCHGSEEARQELQRTAVQLSDIVHRNQAKVREEFDEEIETTSCGDVARDILVQIAFYVLVGASLFWLLCGSTRGAEVHANRPAAVSARKLTRHIIWVYSSESSKQSVDFWKAYRTDAAFKAAIDASYSLRRVEIETCIESFCRGVVPPEFHIPAQRNRLCGFTTKDDLLRRLGLSAVTPTEAPPRLPRPAPPQSFVPPTTAPPKAVADPKLLQAIAEHEAKLKELQTAIDTERDDASQIDEQHAEILNDHRDMLNKQGSFLGKLADKAGDAAKSAVRGMIPEIIDAVGSKVGAGAGAAAAAGETAVAGGGLLPWIIRAAALFSINLTPLGAGITATSVGTLAASWAASYVWKRVRRRWTNRTTAGSAASMPHSPAAVPIHIDVPPAPQVVATNREIVTFEGPNTEAKAYAWALDQWARMYPGSEGAVANVEKLKAQYMSGVEAGRQAKGRQQ